MLGVGRSVLHFQPTVTPLPRFSLKHCPAQKPSMAPGGLMNGGRQWTPPSRPQLPSPTLTHQIP